ncbi:DMT family transporter [Methylobacterium sp. JK268]
MDPASRRPMTASDWGLLLVLSVLWGGSFFFIRVALDALPPFTIVALRLALAALILNALVPLLGARMPRDRRVWAAFLGMGLLNNAIPFSLIAWGQTHIASGLASVLNATTPLTTVVVAHLLTRDERMTGRRLAGVLLGLAGVAVMMGPSVLGGIGADALAQAAVLGAAWSYAFAGVFGRRFGRMGVPPLVTAAGQVTASALLLGPVALLVDRPWTLPVPGPIPLAAVLGLATLSTALAYLIFFRILARAGATSIALVTFLIPVSAIGLGVLILGERLDPRQVAGMALIAAGLAAIDGRVLDRWRDAGGRSLRRSPR